MCCLGQLYPYWFSIYLIYQLLKKSSIDFFIYNSGYISYSFQFLQSLPDRLQLLFVLGFILGAHTFRTVISPWRIDLFIIMWYPFWFMIIFLFLKSTNLYFFNMIIRMFWSYYIGLWYSTPWIGSVPCIQLPSTPLLNSKFSLWVWTVSLFLFSKHNQLPVMLYFL